MWQPLPQNSHNCLTKNPRRDNSPGRERDTLTEVIIFRESRREVRELTLGDPERCERLSIQIGADLHRYSRSKRGG